MPTVFCKRDLQLLLILAIGGSANNSLPVVCLELLKLFLFLYWMLRSYERIMGALSRAPRLFQRIRIYCWDPKVHIANQSPASTLWSRSNRFSQNAACITCHWDHFLCTNMTCVQTIQLRANMRNILLSWFHWWISHLWILRCSIF
jgi:hypothetical protein